MQGKTPSTQLLVVVSGSRIDTQVSYPFYISIYVQGIFCQVILKPIDVQYVMINNQFGANPGAWCSRTAAFKKARQRLDHKLLQHLNHRQPFAFYVKVRCVFFSESGLSGAGVNCLRDSWDWACWVTAVIFIYILRYIYFIFYIWP